MKKIHYTELGVTLFIPSVHKNLQDVACGIKYPSLKSLVVDFEDGITSVEYQQGFECFKKLLENLPTQHPYIFVRPRNTKSLQEILQLKHIEKIEGFVLPKFSLSNAKDYFALLQESDFSIMPSIEGNELFSSETLRQLCDEILPYKKRIILIRFGLEDMLRQLGMRRSCEESLFDRSVTNSVIGSFIALFKSKGFAVSGGVYPCFNDEEGFLRDVKRDLQEGLFSKTIIHPKQIDSAHEVYKVSQKEFEEACTLLENPHAAINLEGKMAEIVTMGPWAKEIVQRAQIYGIAKI